jgi:hypothetical protein
MITHTTDHAPAGAWVLLIPLGLVALLFLVGYAIHRWDDEP